MQPSHAICPSTISHHRHQARCLLSQQQPWTAARSQPPQQQLIMVTQVSRAACCSVGTLQWRQQQPLQVAAAPNLNLLTILLRVLARARESARRRAVPVQPPAAPSVAAAARWIVCPQRRAAAAAVVRNLLVTTACSHCWTPWDSSSQRQQLQPAHQLIRVQPAPAAKTG